MFPGLDLHSPDPIQHLNDLDRDLSNVQNCSTYIRKMLHDKYLTSNRLGIYGTVRSATFLRQK